MSGRLDGLKGTVRQGQPESYEPGRPHEFQAVIDSLVREHEDGTLQRLFHGDNTWELGLERAARHITPALSSLAGRSDAIGSFLDCLFARVCGSGESLEYLFDPVVQALYTLGHNCFTLDLSYLDMDGLHIASCLRSVLPEDDPLALTVKAEGIGYFGWQAHCCDLMLIGDCSELGPYALSSVIRLEGKVGGIIGWRAEDTDFYVPSLGEAMVCHKATGCKVYTLDLGEGNIHFRSSRDGNRLFMPDGKGGWEEVEP